MVGLLAWKNWSPSFHELRELKEKNTVPRLPNDEKLENMHKKKRDI